MKSGVAKNKLIYLIVLFQYIFAFLHLIFNGMQFFEDIKIDF